jgi:intein/homing endonuclease
VFYKELQNSILAPQVVPELGNWNMENDWDKAKVRLLMVFPCTAVTKSVSLSHTSIYALIKCQLKDDCFVDICFQPPPYLQTEISKRYPLLMGGLSKRSWEDFDAIGISIAVMWMDQIIVYQMLKQSKFPLHHKDRIDDGKTPLVVAGGTSIDISAGLDNIVDFYAMGLGERLFERWLHVCMEVKDRHGGDLKKHKQEVIWACRNYEGIIYPSAYDERWEVQNGRVVSELVHVQDGFPKVVSQDMMLPINEYGWMYDEPNWWSMTGYNRKAQVMSSLGAVVEGTRILTSGGMERIETLVGCGPFKVDSLSGMEQAEDVLYQGEKRSSRVHFADRHYLDASNDHIWVVWDGDGFTEKLTVDLKEADVVLHRVGADSYPTVYQEEYGYVIDEDIAFVLGLVLGAGRCRRHEVLANATERMTFQFSVNIEDLERCRPGLDKLFPDGGYSILERRVLGDKKPHIMDISIRRSGKAGTFWPWFTGWHLTGKQIPDVIFKSPLKVMGEYLFGYFQADGCFSRKTSSGPDGNRTPCFSTANPVIRHDIQTLLRYVGVECYGSVVKPPVEHPTWKECFLGHIATYSIPRLIEVIGARGMFKGYIDFKRSSKEGSGGQSQYSVPMTERVQQMIINKCYGGRRLDSSRMGVGRSLLKQRASVISVQRFAAEHPGLVWDEVFTQIINGRVIPVTVKSVEGLPGTFKVYDVLNTESHLCNYGTVITHQCSGASGACSFCHEGATYGAFQERDYDELNRAFYRIKKKTMGDLSCLHSFNSNFLTRFPDLMRDIYKYFNKLSVINFRLSGLANSIRLGGEENNYVSLVRSLGTTTLAGACEGINQRMRNLLNKSLMFDDIKIVMKEAFRNRFLLCKIGMIRCVTAETKYISFNGYIRADELAVGDYVYDGKLFRRILEVVENPSEPIYEVRLRSGLILRSNGEHPYKVKRSRRQSFIDVLGQLSRGESVKMTDYFVPAKDLEVGMPVYTLNNSSPMMDKGTVIPDLGFDSMFLATPKAPGKIDSALATLLGGVVAGLLNDYGYPMLAEDLMATGVLPKLSKWVSGYYYEDLLKTRYGDEYNQKLIVFFEKLFGLSVTANTAHDFIRVPDIIWRSGPDIQWRFLEAVLTVGKYQDVPYRPDGMVDVDKCFLTTCVGTMEFASEIILLLRGIGITAEVDASYKGVKYIAIRGWDMLRYVAGRLINDLPPGVLAKVLRTLSNEYPLRPKDRLKIEFDRVASVTLAGYAKTYGCVVDGHVHVTNGILTHNTGYEEPSDIDEMYNEWKEIIDMRDSMGAGTGLRMNLCLDESALVHTDRGYIAPNKLTLKDHVYDGKGYKWILTVSELPETEIYKVQTYEGFSLKCNAEHPFLKQKVVKGKAVREFTKAIDLAQGDRLVLESPAPSDVSSPEDFSMLPVPDSVRMQNPLNPGTLTLDEEMAWLLGCLSGFCGSIRGQTQVCGDITIACKKLSIGIRIEAFFQNRGIPKKDVLFKYLLDTNSDNYYTIGINSKFCLDLFKNVFDSRSTDYGIQYKCIPKDILESETSILRSYLCGLYSVDGFAEYVNIQPFSLVGQLSYAVVLPGTSIALLNDVQIVLLKLGIYSCFYERGEVSRLDDRVMVSTKVVNLDNEYHSKSIEPYFLVITGISVLTFYEKIGFTVDLYKLPATVKRELEVARADDPDYADKFLATVKEVVQVGRRPVYGCQVNGEVYCANGFVTHNTSLIHEKATPCEMLPRVISYRNWMASMDPGYYTYDFLKLSDLGIRIKTSNELYSIYMQQLQADLPADLIEKTILETSLVADKMTSAHGVLCNKLIEDEGIDLKEQFLRYDYRQGTHQYVQASPSQPVFSKQGLSWFKKTHGICMRTADNYVEGHPVPGCHGCSACGTVDKNYAAIGFRGFPEGFPTDIPEPYKNWSKKREVQIDFNLMDVRDMKIMAEPSFFYQMLVKVGNNGRFVAKEAIARGWLSALANADDKWVLGFRKIMWAGFRLMDNEGFASCHAGYDIFTIGTNTSIEPEDEESITLANAKCPNIKLIRYTQIYESVRAVGQIKYLVEVKLKIGIDEMREKVIPALETGKYLIYKQTPGMVIKAVKCSIMYKIVTTKDGYVIYILMPPRFSPVLMFLKSYNYNVLMLRKLISCNVVGIYNLIRGADSYEDLVNDKIVDIKGFKVVHAAVDDEEDNPDMDEDEDDAPDLEGG